MSAERGRLSPSFSPRVTWLYVVLRLAADWGCQLEWSIMPHTECGRKSVAVGQTFLSTMLLVARQTGMSAPRGCCLPAWRSPMIIAIRLQPAILPGVTSIFFPARVLFPQKH